MSAAEVAVKEEFSSDEKVKLEPSDPTQKLEIEDTLTITEDKMEVEEPVLIDNAINKTEPKFEPEDPQPSTSSSSSSSSELTVEGSILQLKIVLRYITPLIWRRIQVVNTDTFSDLHWYIQEAMGWGSHHSYMFIAPDKSDPERNVTFNPPYALYCDDENGVFKDTEVKLMEYLKSVNDVVLYEYDLGDSWMHEIVVEKILPPPKSKKSYPKCLGGKRACPPDDCGGVDGYQRLLEVRNNPEHEEYEELTDWLEDSKPDFDPEKFDHKKVFNKNKIFMKV